MKLREFCLRQDVLIINNLDEQQQLNIPQIQIRVREVSPELDAAYAECERALKFYSGQLQYEGKNYIEWNPHVCDSYSGLRYAPDWPGDLQDEPGEIAEKALAALKKAKG
jgi:hypothetical protein